MLKLFGAVPSVILGILVTKFLRQTFLSFKNTLHDENSHVKVQTYVFESLNFLALYLLSFLIKALTWNTSGFFIKHVSVMPVQKYQIVQDKINTSQRYTFSLQVFTACLFHIFCCTLSAGSIASLFMGGILLLNQV